MITAEGRRFIKRYLAGQAGSIVGTISVGIGNAAPTINDSRLQFEFARVPLIVTTYDFANDELVFKGTLGEDIEGTIYEVAIWTNDNNTALGSQAGMVLTSFDSVSEEWDIETFEGPARIGADCLKHTPAASAVSASVLTGITLDLVDYSSQDAFVLAYEVQNSNTASVKVRMRTDSANYYEFTVNNPTTGYKFSTFLKGAASVVGTPSWENINEIEVRTTATGGGSASVKYDGLRIEDTDSVAPDYGMVARFVPALPIMKSEGIVHDIEYSIQVNI